MSFDHASESSLGSRVEIAPISECGAGSVTDMLQQPWVSDGNGSVAPSKTTAKRSMNQETDVAPRFLIIKRENGEDFSKINPFLLHRWIYSLAGEVKAMKKIRDGLLIETASAAQSRLLLRSNKLGDLNVEISPHGSLNKSRGVITCRDLLNCSVEEICSELRSQGVIDVRRMKTRINGELKESPSHILTFNTLNLPNRIKAAYYSLPVRLYIPPPLRCFRCQRFGHVSTRCTNSQVCVCGKEFHQGRACAQPIICINCEGHHSARSRECPVFKKEMAIQELKTKESIPYMTAKKKLTECNTPISGVSYAQAVKETTKTSTSELVKALIPPLIDALKALFPMTSSLDNKEANDTTIKHPSILTKEVERCPNSQSKRKTKDRTSSPATVSESDASDASLAQGSQKKKIGRPNGKKRISGVGDHS